MKVILTGTKHCGKSTLGRALAKRWGCAMYDLDALIEDTAAARAGRRRTVREIFREDGEEAFRRLEADVLGELMAQLAEQDTPAVVALGGGVVGNKWAKQHLAGRVGTLVYLHADPTELFKRVAAGGIPPFLDPDDPEGHFLRLAESRGQLCREAADLVVDVTALDPEAALETLSTELENYAHGR